ncbi:neutral zinc metallopeptidase [Solirubrobacter pauli]|uniref:neutral zinc metallopeptidase n=1 Tax=Solirubrobacter pauli TaxID=166793 RepID=UPI000EB32847|nr:neutral zinc metallopeptidase [Solirubrobacter pauli]
MLTRLTRRAAVGAAGVLAGCALALPATSIAAPTPLTPFLDGLLSNVTTYWDQTDAALGRPAPAVGHVWVAPGAKVATACGAEADDGSAFYCSADDTIYVGQRFAGELYDGVLASLPGQRAGFGRAAGAVAVGYVIAHEFAHNVQAERRLPTNPLHVLPIELNADCLAGTYTRWAYGQGEVTDAQVEQVLDAALAVGDFDFLSPQHHGTPRQRRQAVLTGFDSGRPAACDAYLLS